MTHSLGFIILRHVTSPETNRYWNICYQRIREFYPSRTILIIDDNSNPEYITADERTYLHNYFVIQSEYPGRGELLPYYYYARVPFCSTAVILHDSTFMNAYVPFSAKKYRPLWDFDHASDQSADEAKIIASLTHDDSELVRFYWAKHLWKGCFGGMAVINHNYLISITRMYDFTVLLQHIVNRYHRQSFERIIACMLRFHVKDEDAESSLFGDIASYCRWGIPFAERGTCDHLPLIKVWTGR